jgi:hypothetical protein
MTTSVSRPALAAHGFGDDQWEGRLRGLTREQLADRLIWLSWWSLGTFQVVMDYMEFIDNLDTDGDAEAVDVDEPAPFCGTCGAQVGISARFSLGWVHFRTVGQCEIEPFEPGHDVEVVWRSTAPAAA